MGFMRTLLVLLLVAATGCGGAAPASTPSPAGQEGGRPGGGRDSQEAGPKPFDDVITEDAVSDEGLFTVHKVGDDYFFQIPDSLMGRDMLLISRSSGIPAGMGFTPAGMSVNEQLIRFERMGDRVLLRKYGTQNMADDSMAISASVRANNFAPILAAFDVEAIGLDSASTVIDVTDFYEGDTRAISGLRSA